eukprot:262822_1
MGNEVVNFFLPVSQTINAINIVTTLAEGKPLVEPFDPFISGLSRGIAFDVQPGIGVVLGGAIGASIAVGRVKIAAESLPESEIKCIYCRRDLPNITKWEQLGTTYMDDRLTHVYYDGKYYRFEGSDEYWCSNDTPRKRKQKEVLKLLSEEARKEKKKELENTNELLAYSDDLDYLVDHFKVIELRIKAFLSNLEEQDSYKFTSKKSQKTTLRELRSSEKNAYKKCVARIEITKQGKWLPRLERLVIKRHLDEFEKWVILTLIGCIISVDIIKSAGLQNRYRDAMTVGEMLGANCLDLRAQIKHRKYFYKTATLVKENIIKVHESRLLHNSDLMHSCLEIDRRMVDYCVALDTEFGALVEGSSLYTPNVTLEQVVLAKETKQLILDTIEGMEQFRKIVSKFNHNTNANTNGHNVYFHDNHNNHNTNPNGNGNGHPSVNNNYNFQNVDFQQIKANGAPYNCPFCHGLSFQVWADWKQHWYQLHNTKYFDDAKKKIMNNQINDNNQINNNNTTYKPTFPPNPTNIPTNIAYQPNNSIHFNVINSTKKRNHTTMTNGPQNDELAPKRKRQKVSHQYNNNNNSSSSNNSNDDDDDDDSETESETDTNNDNDD